MSNSTHSAFVVPINLEPHPNADKLSIVKFEGFTCCVRTEDWVGKTKGVHIQPDSVVDTTRPEFSFLAKEGKNTARVRVAKMRGIVSYGFLIPVDDNATIGEDYAETLGVEHYVPLPNLRMGGDNVSPPPGYFPKYDIDGIRKYHDVFQDGELVAITEKIHGANMRVVYSSDKEEMYVGSRTNWKKEDDKCVWWQAFKKYPQIEDFCRENPDCVLYGEVYGQVQNLKYGKTGVDFAAFDIGLPYASKFVDFEKFINLCDNFALPHVPIIAMSEPYNFDKIVEWSNGKSLIDTSNHHREGCVVKPMVERYDESIGRVILKCVGEDYFLKTKKGK